MQKPARCNTHTKCYQCDLDKSLAIAWEPRRPRRQSRRRTTTSHTSPVDQPIIDERDDDDYSDDDENDGTENIAVQNGTAAVIQPGGVEQSGPDSGLRSGDGVDDGDTGVSARSTGGKRLDRSSQVIS